jgi:hypothetical protein
MELFRLVHLTDRSSHAAVLYRSGPQEYTSTDLDTQFDRTCSSSALSGPLVSLGYISGPQVSTY